MTFSSYRSTRQTAVVLVVCALALGAGACGGGGDDDGDGALPGSGSDSGGESSDGAGDSASGDSDAGTLQPAENLGIEARSEEGVTMTVNGISTDGDNVVVDIAMLNGSSGAVDIHNTTWEETQLRLVDEEGNNYNFLPPEEYADGISMEIGEEISGSLEFIGPITTQSQYLYLVTNMDNDIEAIQNWQPGDTCSNACGGEWPGLVAEIPVEWA